MIDAIPAGQIVEKAVTETAKNAPQQGESQFAQILTERMDQADQQSEMTKKIMESFGMTPQKEMKAVSAAGLDISVEKISSASGIMTHEKPLKFLDHVNRGALQMDSFIELATSGQKFTPAELLALQAGVHQIALEVDLTGKIMENVNNSFKTIQNTNFGG